MNSEELEMSLRTEFESYLKDVSAEMRQEISELREKVESEIERHKSNLSEIFDAVLVSAENEREIGADFRESIVEHLRLAKDEGARITATAIAEAEEMQKAEDAAPLAAPAVGVKEVFEAVNDISSKDSQAEILKSLVSRASQFAPRGAFFILKNDYLVGWRMFGMEETVSDDVIREVFLQTSSDSVLSEAVRSLSAVESTYGTYSNDSAFLDKLEFGAPDKMYAIPLVARGRGVAVLYADNGSSGEIANVEALETLVRVAGLTVEVLASGRSLARREFPKPAPVAAAVESFSSPGGFVKEPPPFQSPDSLSQMKSVPVETAEPAYEQAPEFEPSSYRDSYEQSSFDNDSFRMPDDGDSSPTPEASADVYETGKVAAQDAPAETVEKYPAYEDSSWNQPARDTASTGLSAQEYAQNFVRDTDPGEYVQDYSHPAVTDAGTVSDDYAANEYAGQPVSGELETAQFESTNAFRSTESAAPTEKQNFGSFEAPGNQPQSSFQVESTPPASFETFEPVAQPAPESAPVKSRLSERNVDLPIEVNDDERRLHNDARRFARLLVSEIKLYNEQKVREGRENNDLYQRLREAIDRSREMYDKRVQSAVAAKFDYFHYELVNTLAEGDAARLGSDYPGATV